MPAAALAGISHVRFLRLPGQAARASRRWDRG